MENMQKIIESLRNNEFIKEKELGNGVSSFNFSKKAFYGGYWNNQTITARGLFIDTIKNKVVCRGYPKFFRYGEQGITEEYLRHKLSFPISIYKKENGFLGLFTSFQGKAIFATKSQFEGKYNTIFENCMKSCLSDLTIEELRLYCEKNDCTILFEVIDMEADPHIIEYPVNKKVVLLDIVNNNISFQKMEYENLVKFASKYNLEIKERFSIINYSHTVLMNLINSHTSVNRSPVYFLDASDKFEGFVLEDSNGFMFKLKTPYYSMWKMMRNVAGAVRKHGGYKHPDKFKDNRVAQYFYQWLLNNKDDISIITLIEANNIIALREKFIAEATWS